MKATQKRQAAVSLQKSPFLTDEDVFLFNEGNHYRLYEKLGAHPLGEGREGTYFAVWAPDAERVSVIGAFNDWNRGSHPLKPRGNSGIWEGVISEAKNGDLYKFFIKSRFKGYEVEKTDPFARFCELPPKSASIVWEKDYSWKDSSWMKERAQRNALSAPLSIYEVHLGSWMRSEKDNLSLSYREMAPKLSEYVKKMGYTHVELMPVMEHPFYGSWGYQITGYFAPSSRFGTPEDFKFLVDHLHQNGIGVILDWVPSHFPNDEHGLGYFDGSHLFEHSDPRKGFHPDWESLIFNYGRNEVKSFLISNALYWLDQFHIDGLRVDAVASMLYLDYSRKEGEWIPNEYGGRENLEAMQFLKRFNEVVYQNYPDVQTIAEESTAWPMVSRPTYLGGLGFGMKWDMGWMHDTLQYFTKDPVYRRHHHNTLTFRMVYAFNENFVLSLSHDEVVHGKGSLINKMPGDEWQKFANLRCLFGYMFAQPGKKLMFMGDEIGQWKEWNHNEGLDWDLTQKPLHEGLQKWVADLNAYYREAANLHRTDFDPSGFEWMDASDSDQSVFSFLRKKGESIDLFILNATPLPRENYRVGAPKGGYWKEVLNSDSEYYGGSGVGNMGGVESKPVPCHGRNHSLTLRLPPLGFLAFRWEKPLKRVK